MFRQLIFLDISDFGSKTNSLRILRKFLEFFYRFW